MRFAVTSSISRGKEGRGRRSIRRLRRLHGLGKEGQGNTEVRGQRAEVRRQRTEDRD